VSNLSSHPEEFLEEAEKGLVTYRAKYGGRTETEAFCEHCTMSLQAKRALYADAHHCQGNTLGVAGRLEEAIEHYRHALRLKPDLPETHYNLGVALAKGGAIQDAVDHFQQALRLKPDYAAAQNSLAIVLTTLGQVDEAIEHFQQAVRLKPDWAAAHQNLADCLASLGRNAEAAEHYQKAVQLKPYVAATKDTLGDPPPGRGKSNDVEPTRRTLPSAPQSTDALNDRAWLLATRDPAQGGDPLQALQLAQQANEQSGQQNPHCLDTLAAAYAAAGQLSEAVAAAEQAVQLAESTGQAELAQRIQRRLELYRAGQPYRDAGRRAPQTTP
jgi:tetratricopeptide (TPR) repeat protein